ncbi:PAS domain S-box protein [Sphingomonas sp. BK235]|uniref:PAS domain S-box protein n=1 Tax=Sphingomonas sp. BK235 TaxID=2512131 RepID=UPI00104F9A9E|nr:PAS domain S-box protein [Sphingomonas sp. BK235]TCP37438.1 PAS/PAC sensor hybrid histidine kinase [Sphingomonas sp. BK235]
MNHPLTSPSDPTLLFAHGGEMGARILAHDWAGSPLGPIAGWPSELRNALALALPARVEIVLFWGADYVALYNDAYAPTIGAKHPSALGRPAREAWSELWDDLEPLLSHVRTSGETFAAKDRPFYIERAGHGETVYFDVSYSPVPLADGSVGGVLCIVSETTARVRAARAMAEDRERLREMFDQAPGFIAVLRQPGHVVELANASYRRLVGGRDVVGRPLAEAVPELVQRGLVEKLDAVVARAQPYRGTDVPLLLPRDDGGAEERRLDFILQPITDAGGTVTAVFVEGTDVTDRHRAESALALSRDSLELATEAGEIGTWDYDLVVDRFTCSPRTWAMYGIEPGPARTLGDFGALLHPEDRPRVRDAFLATIDPVRRARYDIEYRSHPAPDGSVRWLAVRGRGLFEGDRCVRAIGTVIDVTARKREADALRESEARFRMLADSLPALTWLTDAELNLTFASEGFRTILGFDPDTVVSGGWLSLLPSELRAAAARRLVERQRARDPLSGDYRLLTRDGGERWVHAEARPRFLGGTFLGYVGCAIDVTEAHLAGELLEARVEERTAELTRQVAERERVEETLHQLQRLEAIGQLTSGVAHDFNNLLMVVLGNVELVSRAAARGALTARALEQLDHIRAAAERGATLTGQLLAFSRRQRLEAKVVDLNAAVTGLVPLLESTLGRSIAINAAVCADPWPAMVDPTQLELILLNLAINARDAMPGGGTLRVATANVRLGAPNRPEEPAAGDYVRVAVSDTGTGMTPEVLARAFEPFFTTKEVGKGSGLGLAQVFGFAKQSGGGVRIDTAPGEGTTVSVYVPRAAVAPAPVATDSAAPTAASIARRCVLVLDDEDRVREITAEALRDSGCRVIEAADGAAALDALAADPAVEAVVADVAMPGMNGIEFGRRARIGRPTLPVLFVTGYADADELAALPEAQVIRKPFTRAQLVERLAALLAAATPELSRG